MKLFNEPEIRHHIGWLGGKELSLMLRKGENAVDYRYVLDAVPLDDEKNAELKELLNL